MSPITLSTDNLNILFPKNKKYNPYVGWVDVVVYFRVKNRLQKRKFLVISKTTAVKDYNNFLNIKPNFHISDEEKRQQELWLLCRKKSLKEFEKDKKIFIRHVYDIPEIGDEIHQDTLYTDSLSDDGQKPYASEVVVPDATIDVKTMYAAAKYYLKSCFGVNCKLKDINFTCRFNDTDIKREWKEYKKQKDRMGELRKQGIRPNIVFKESAAKYLFGDNVKEFKIEGSKKTIVFNDGTKRTEVQRNFKVLDSSENNIKAKKGA